MNASPPPALPCSVRNCAKPLTRAEKTWYCESGHTFDIARSGYLNLIQPQDRRSLNAGDGRETVAARRALLDSGFGTALRAALLETIDSLALAPALQAVDLGCGEGYFLAELCAQTGFQGCGIDLSAHAVESAARRFPQHLWIAANADRRLPLLDSAWDLVLSIDGRRPRDEIARVLRPDGLLLVAIPAANDLIELRGAVLAEVLLTDQVAKAEAALAPHFQLRARRTVQQTRELDRVGLAQLAAATYRCARRREMQALASLEQLTVTTAHEVLVFGKSVPGLQD